MANYFSSPLSGPLCTQNHAITAPMHTTDESAIADAATAAADKPTTARIIRKPELRKRVPYSDTTIWRKERDGKFPRRIELGPNAVGWLESEIDAWIASRKRK
jgi:prophage regulatory protein